jgi:hypothetical protein
VNVSVPRHLRGLLKHGRVVDTTEMKERLGFEPSFTCRQTVLSAYGHDFRDSV